MTDDCETWEMEQARTITELRRECERLNNKVFSAETQLCEISKYFGKDARHVEGEGPHTIASLVIQEHERLRHMVCEMFKYRLHNTCYCDLCRELRKAVRGE